MDKVLPDTAALLVIDVQEALDDPRRPPRNNPDAEANIARLLAAWRATERRCVHIRDDSLNPDSPFAPGQPGNAIKTIVAPLPDEWLIGKHVHSAFIGTDLEARLRGAGITTLVITGLVANHCVESTARMAGNLGFDTYVVGDATAAYDGIGPDGTHYAAAAIHAMTLMNLHKEFATITTTDGVIAALAVPSGMSPSTGDSSLA
ncbi:MAG: cysteine hydrolase family protein [Thermomicrobiales bacterium]